MRDRMDFGNGNSRLVGIVEKRVDQLAMIVLIFTKGQKGLMALTSRLLNYRTQTKKCEQNGIATS